MPIDPNAVQWDGQVNIPGRSPILPAPINPAAVQWDAEPASSQIGDFASAALHHLANMPHGIAQLIENGVAKGADWVDPASQNLGSLVTGQRVRSPWNQAIQDVVASDNAAMAKREADYQASTPNSPGAYAGAATGEVVPFLLSAPARAAGWIGNGASKLATDGLSSLSANVPGWVSAVGGKVASGAAQGATIAATQPVATPGDYWDQKTGQVGTGAALGGAIPVATTAAGSAASGIRDAARPFTDPNSVVAEWAQKQADRAGVTPAQLAAQLQAARKFVPGSNPTTAQAAPLPFLVQAEKTVTTNPDMRGTFADIQAQNNMARIGQLNQIAGQPGTLDQALANRESAANAGYAKAYSLGPNPDLVTPAVDKTWTALQQRPAIKDAFAQGRRDLESQGVFLPEGNSPYDPHIVQLSDFAKKALDSQIAALDARGSTLGRAGLVSSRDALVSAIDKISPDYQVARQAYASASPPINSMQAGTKIIEGLMGKPLTTAMPGELAGAPLITSGSFQAQLNQALRGQQFGIESDALTGLQAIRDDLQRETASNALKTAGSDTAYNLQAPGLLARSLYGADYSGSNVGPRVAGGALGGIGGLLFGGHIGGAAGVAAGQQAASKVASAGNARVMGALSDAMADPAVMAKLLTQTMPGTGVNPSLVRLGNALRIALSRHRYMRLGWRRSRRPRYLRVSQSVTTSGMPSAMVSRRRVATLSTITRSMM